MSRNNGTFSGLPSMGAGGSIGTLTSSITSVSRAGFSNGNSALYPAYPSTTARAHIGTAINPSQNTAFSLGGWFKLDSDAGDVIALSTWDTSGFISGILMHTVGSDLKLIFATAHGQGYSMIITWAGVADTLKNGSWHHLLLTYTGVPQNTNAKLYVDGALASATLGTNSLPDWMEYVAANGLTIGGSPVTIGSLKSWAGKIDEVVYYSACLNAAAATALYNGGEPAEPDDTNLTHWYRMGDGDDSNTTILDQVGSANATGTDINISTDVP